MQCSTSIGCRFLAASRCQIDQKINQFWQLLSVPFNEELI
jgi:hypothetical protein